SLSGSSFVGSVTLFFYLFSLTVGFQSLLLNEKPTWKFFGVTTVYLSHKISCKVKIILLFYEANP
ncbi:hypothetical protein ACNNM0_07560, partial [Aerococcus viridans]